MSSRKTAKALARYVNAASDLAEAVKRNIVHGSMIDDKTVVVLNEFIIAANEIKDMTDELNNKVIKYNN